MDRAVTVRGEHVRARRLPTGGRGAQANRQLLLLRYLASADEWVPTAELVEQLYGAALRTLYRDLRQLQAAGIPIEWDASKERGWRLRPVLAVEWILGDRRRALRALREIRSGQCRECAAPPLDGIDACALHASPDEKASVGICTSLRCPNPARAGRRYCEQHAARVRDRMRRRRVG